MKRARFIAPARAELLAEVAYYNNKELGLGSRFLAVVEDATARALAYPLTGSPASENTRQMLSPAGTASDPAQLSPHKAPAAQPPWPRPRPAR